MFAVAWQLTGGRLRQSVAVRGAIVALLNTLEVDWGRVLDPDRVVEAGRLGIVLAGIHPL